MVHLVLRLLFLFSLGAALPSGREATAADERPNILIVLVDDMGWSDLGCYGGEIRTPNVDALAAGGLRFSAFYNTGRCCPTRASLLTGLYPHQAGVGQMTADRNLPGYRGQLGRNAVTIAEVLRAAGYQPSMLGKWHLSLTRQLDGHMRHLNNQQIRDTFADPASYPVGRGFDNHYGIIWGVVNFYDPFSLVQNTEAVRELPDDYYITDALNARAVELVEKHSQQDKPFFLYLAHCAPHWPLHALPEDIRKYDGVYDSGWEAIRSARYRRQLDMGLLGEKTAPLRERFGADKQWSENPDQAWDARRMACHAAMIDRLDQGVGRIVERLKQLGELDNTLIFFLSDNGASREEPDVPGFDRVSQTRDGREVVYYGRGKHKEVLPGPETTYAGIGPHWANVANTPLREFKASQYEGGIRTPLVVHWPRGVKAPAGSITPQAGHVIDLMATCLDAAGTDYPQTYNSHDIVPLEGKSLLPIFQGRERDGHDAIFFEHYGARAVRQGDWKLVAPSGGKWELYHLSEDQTETRNLAREQPERVSELAALWQQWAERANVLPSPGP